MEISLNEIQIEYLSEELQAITYKYFKEIGAYRRVLSKNPEDAENHIEAAKTAVYKLDAFLKIWKLTTLMNEDEERRRHMVQHIDGLLEFTDEIMPFSEPCD